MNQSPRWNDLPLNNFKGLWRVHADGVNQSLYRRWFADSDGGLLVKTDSFEEAVGEGPLAGLAARKTVLLDASESLLREALRRHPALSGIVCDARAIPLSNSCDRVLSFSTFDHFESRICLQTAIENTYRALRPGGKALILMDNPRNPVVAVRNRFLRQWMGKTPLVPYFMGVTLPLPELASEVERCGFRVEATATTLHCPRVLAIPICQWLSRAPEWVQKAWLSALRACEILERLPTRELSGHFVGVLAVKD